jgi:Tol biopolymer transport system component/DNA-binding winged helix-turn-helix (wHTH) protein
MTALQQMPGVFSICDRRVDSSLHRVTGPAGSVHLEPKVMRVLVVLAEHAGHVVPKGRLLQTVWSDVFVGDEVLTRAISELRSVFGDDPKAPRFIETIPKGGYRLIAPVTLIGTAPTPLEPEPDQVGRTPKGRAGRRIFWGALIVLVLAASIAIVFLFQARSFLHARSQPLMKVVPFTTMPGVEGGPTFSPDGTRIAFYRSPQPDSPDSRIMVKLIGIDPPQELTHGPGDMYPAWSPDGRWIAFTRDAGERSGLYLVPAVGGPEWRVSSVRGCGGPAWAPDSRTLAFGGATKFGSCVGLYAVSLDSLETRELTEAVGPQGCDWFPAYSPDGHTIAFVRYRAAYVSDIHMMPAVGGKPKRLTFDDNTIWGRLAWTPDATAILFASSRMGSATLWRVSTAGGQPERLGIDADAEVALDASHHQLATVFYRFNIDLNAIDLRDPTRPPVKIAPSTYIDESPSFSPNGKQIAFRSNRLGHNDIWIADADGSNATHLTAIERGSNGSPQWSPDGERLVFDSSSDGQFDLFVVRVAGGDPIRLTSDSSNEYVPTWSRDGQWIFFASDRTWANQVWRMPANGGTATQITKAGGYGGLESADRKYLYYTKGGFGRDGVWRVPIDGGAEEPILADVPRGDYLRSWTLVDGGIYYLDTRNERQPSVQFFSFASHRTKHIVTLNAHVTGSGPTLTISPAGRTMIIQLDESMGSDIIRVENFR